MQLGFQVYGGSLGLWRVRWTARRPLAVKPRGMESCGVTLEIKTKEHLKPND